jgi:quinoprotein glucose dehydrogenase
VRICVIIALALLFAASLPAAADGWSAYGGDAGGTRYSPLKQITRANVAKLKVAWTYHTGALQPETRLNEKAAFEATPILVNGALYLSTPFNQVIALDPATGAEKWKFDPQVSRTHGYSEVTSRGVAAWTDRKRRQGRALPSADLRRHHRCAPAGDRRPDRQAVRGFRRRRPGRSDAGRGFPEILPRQLRSHIGAHGGGRRGDHRLLHRRQRGREHLERGVVRGYDTRTGKLLWTWDPIPWANQQKVRTGAANAWSTIAADEKRGLVFIPTGSASPDYYGGERPGDNRWANSVVALKASTGEFVWGFQVVHHDLWDYDVASEPTLIEFRGKAAVAVTTKMGNVFVLDRETGKPLSTVEERAVPKSDIPGEDAAPSQPIPAWSAMVPQKLTAADAWGPTPEMRKWCQEKIESYRNDGLFTPPSFKGTIAFPGNIGGVNWGSAAWDPVRNILLANTNRVAAVAKLIPRADLAAARQKPDEMAWGGEFAPQRGTPYGMHRDWLVSPSECLATRRRGARWWRSI